jgi:hypothetical protein
MKILAALLLIGPLFSTAVWPAAAADRPAPAITYVAWARICFTTPERVINAPKPPGEIRDLNKAMTAERETREDSAGLARRVPGAFKSI